MPEIPRASSSGTSIPREHTSQQVCYAKGVKSQSPAAASKASALGKLDIDSFHYANGVTSTRSLVEPELKT